MKNIWSNNGDNLDMGRTVLAMNMSLIFLPDATWPSYKWWKKNYLRIQDTEWSKNGENLHDNFLWQHHQHIYRSRQLERMDFCVRDSIFCNSWGSFSTIVDFSIAAISKSKFKKSFPRRTYTISLDVWALITATLFSIIIPHIIATTMQMQKS